MPRTPVERAVRGEFVLSPAGTAMLSAWLADHQPVDREYDRRLKEVRVEIRVLAGKPDLDLRRFGELVQREDALIAERRAAGTTAFLELLARLAPADRIALVKMSGPAGLQGHH